MKKSFIVVGLGRFGLGIVRTLADLKCDVLAIDVDELAVNKAAEFLNNCAICDSTKLSALKELGINDIDHAVVAIGGNFQATILTVINLHELGIKKITVRIDDGEYEPVMERLGATEVVIPEEASALSLAHQIVSDNILDYYQINDDYGVVKLNVSANFKEATLADLDLRNKFDVNIVGLVRGNKFMIPKGTDMICPNDAVLFIGKGPKITKVERFLNN